MTHPDTQYRLLVEHQRDLELLAARGRARRSSGVRRRLLSRIVNRRS